MGPDGFLPILIMYDGAPADNKAYGDELGLSFPILSDTSLSIFDRWDPTGETPSTTMISRGLVVEEVDTTWYPQMIEDLVYAED